MSSHTDTRGIFPENSVFRARAFIVAPSAVTRVESGRAALAVAADANVIRLIGTQTSALIALFHWSYVQLER